MATDDSLPNDALIKVRVDRVMRETLERLARREDRSLSAEVRRALREHVARSSLATGAGGPVSAGLAGSSALVASDGALAEPGQGADTGRRAEEAPHDGRAGARRADPRPGSASASPFVPDALKPSVETPAEVAKAVAASVPGVTFAHSLAGPAKPLSKQEQAGRKK